MHTPAVKASGVAVLQIGGWSDAAVAGQFESQRVWGGKTVMGPWVHGNRSLPTVRHAGDTFDVNAEILRWFDHYARGMDNGAGKSEIVYYTQNAVPGTEWRKAANWTAASGVRQPFFLSGQALSSRAPAAGGKPVTYAQQEVKLFEGRYSPLRRMWEGNMSEADAKSLVHTGPVLAGNFQVTGTPTARLWVSTDTRDTNVFAILEDVAPDGKVSYVSDGRLRASWRKLNPTPWGPSSQLWHRGYAEDIKPMVPGQPTELAFDFFPVSYVFQKGHRIRLSIVTSIANKWQDPPMTDSKPVNLTLYQDARHPSKVELPIVR
ncbi:conserved hypothetical protein (plasmid) [Novosphingobium sp. PP1Y]|nr:conserved hypothetical protein [Novosphingobium sp. PP1Y]